MRFGFALSVGIGRTGCVGFGFALELFDMIAPITIATSVLIVAQIVYTNGQIIMPPVVGSGFHPVARQGHT